MVLVFVWFVLVVGAFMVCFYVDEGRMANVLLLGSTSPRPPTDLYGLGDFSSVDVPPTDKWGLSDFSSSDEGPPGMEDLRGGGPPSEPPPKRLRR